MTEVNGLGVAPDAGMATERVRDGHFALSRTDASMKRQSLGMATRWVKLAVVSSTFVTTS